MPLLKIATISEERCTSQVVSSQTGYGMAVCSIIVSTVHRKEILSVPAEYYPRKRNIVRISENTVR
ncbi:hypothetical protein J22TS1_08500 [Siminovitchia terrae]|nr:hypothetical protein J22TS1_08500 [Siminovitchia terrae]